MRQVAFWSPKGGVGKTTLALNFAAAAYYSGLKVLLCDLDPQLSAFDIFNKKNLPFSVIPNHPSIIPKVDMIVYDHSPNVDQKPVADTVIIPMRPSILDLKAVNRSSKLVREKRVIRCVNAVDSRRTEERMMAMKLYSDGAHLIKDRSIYGASLAGGETVFQTKSYGASEAKQELQRLLDRVMAGEN